MRKDEDRYMTLAVSFLLSLAANGSAVVGFDRVVSPAWQIKNPHFILPKPKENRLDFEFVDAAPVQAKTKLTVPRKISAHDQENRDLSKIKSKRPAPRTRSKRKADQMAQRRAASQPTAVPSAPTAPQPVVTSPPASAVPAASVGGNKDPLAMSSEPVVEKPHVEEQAKNLLSASAGQGRIIAEESSRIESKGALLQGMTSFEATGSGMGEYMQKLKERIWLEWFPYLSFKYPGGFKTADAVIGFTLDADGKIRMAKILERRGDSVFATFCLEAIQKAAPFGPLPKDILALVGKDEIQILFGFHLQ